MFELSLLQIAGILIACAITLRASVRACLFLAKKRKEKKDNKEKNETKEGLCWHDKLGRVGAVLALWIFANFVFSLVAPDFYTEWLYKGEQFPLWGFGEIGKFFIGFQLAAIALLCTIVAYTGKKRKPAIRIVFAATLLTLVVGIKEQQTSDGSTPPPPPRRKIQKRTSAKEGWVTMKPIILHAKWGEPARLNLRKIIPANYAEYSFGLECVSPGIIRVRNRQVACGPGFNHGYKKIDLPSGRPIVGFWSHEKNKTLVVVVRIRYKTR